MREADNVRTRATFIPQSSRAAILLDVVRQFVGELEHLAQEHGEIDAVRRQRITDAAREIRRRLDRDELWVAIVGEFNAGKSTFLNAVLGAPVLGTSVREFTGVVTVLRYGSEPDYEYETESGRRIRFVDEVPDHRPELRRKVSDAQAESTRRTQQLTAFRLIRTEASDRQQRARAAFEDSRAREEADVAQLEVATSVAADCRTQLAGTIGEENRSAALVPTFVRVTPPWWALWLWFARTLAGWVWRRQRAAWQVARTARIQRETLRGQAEAGLIAWTTSAADTRHLRSTWESETREARVALSAANDSVSAAEQSSAHAKNAIEEAQRRLATYETERRSRFVDNVRHLAAIDRKDGLVRAATIHYPSSLLAQGLVLLDTPGLNTPQKQYEDRSWAAIERDADACLLLTPAGQAMGKSTREALVRMREHVPHVALAITKTDKAEEDIFSDDPAEIRAQVQEVIRESVRRFAQDMGRSESDVVWMDTAAERAIPGRPKHQRRWTDEFNAMLSRLTRVLATERVAVLGVRAARIGGEAARVVREEVSRLEAIYSERIQALEAARLPDPKAEVERIASMHRRPQAEAIDHNTGEAAEGLSTVVTAWCADIEGEIQRTTDKDALDKFVKNLLPSRTEHLAMRLQANLDAFGSACSRSVEAEVRSAVTHVHERYRIAAQLGRGHVAVPTFQFDMRSAHSTGIAQLSDTLGAHSDQNLLAGGMGAGAGAAIGTIFLPGIGTLVGGVLGGVAGWLFGPGLNELKGKVGAGCVSIATQTGSLANEHLTTITQLAHSSAITSMRRALEDEVLKYNSWIEQVLAAEQQRIDAERKRLRDLLERAKRIDARAVEMTKRVADIAQESSMMARTPQES